TQTQRDSRINHGIDVEIMTVELSLQPDHSADAYATDQPSDPIAQNVGVVEGLFHKAGITGPRRNLTYRRPLRAFDTMRAVPLGVFRNHNTALVRRNRPRATDPALVLKHIGMQGGLIRVVPLFNARRIYGKIERSARGGRVIAEVPQSQTVVTIDRLDDIGLGVELYAHLAEIVAQQHANLTTDGRILETRKPGLEHRAAFDDKTVVVVVGRIKQSS